MRHLRSAGRTSRASQKQRRTDEMDHKTLARARFQCEVAQTKLDAMRQAKDVCEVALLWSELLIYVQRCFITLRKATRDGSSKGWSDRIVHIRSEDPLLSYTMHARNADEHVEAVTLENPWRIDIRPNQESVSIVNDQMIVQGGKAVHFDVTAPESKLLPVRDRGGNIHNPPSEHLGKPIENVTHISIAELVLNFLRAALDEAANKFS